MNIRRILFPVDFSERSEAAAPFVHSLALRHSASVVLLNVIQPPPPMYGGMNTIYPESFDYTENRDILRRWLDQFAALQFPKIETSVLVDVGEPATLIVDYAHNNSVDLIAMPTHGYGPFRALLGSVTAKVLHDAKIPVWTSAHAPEPSHRAHPQPRRILVAIDPEKQARPTLDAAVAFAAETNATLEMITAVAEGVIAPGMADTQLEDLLLEGTREELAKLQFEAGTGLGMVVQIGSPARVIRDAALAKRADLVIVGRGGGEGILGRIRADGYAIIREAPCPVLSL